MLDIAWLSTQWPTEHKDGYGDVPVALSQLSSFQRDEARPFFVFIDEKREAADEDKLMRKLFGIEEVVMGSKLFNCYRMNVEDIPDSKLQKQYGKKLPAIFFYDAKGKEIGKVTGSKKAKTVFGKLGKLYKSFYAKGSLTKWVDTYNDKLKDMEKAEDTVATAKKTLSGVQERADKKKKKTKKILKSIAEAKTAVSDAEKAFSKAKDVVAKHEAVKTKTDKKVTAAR
ncbi:MAG: hypothetical protein V3W41_03335 [Planctomycetota bacterium]